MRMLLPVAMQRAVEGSTCLIAVLALRMARVRSRASPYGIRNGSSGNGTGSAPSISVFPSQNVSKNDPSSFIHQPQAQVTFVIDNIDKQHT